MRRMLAVLVGAGIAVGGGAAAWAGTAGADAPKRAAAKACLDAARQEAPAADRAALREAVKACLKEAGIEGRSPSPEQQAKREALRSCLKEAKEARGANPGPGDPGDRGDKAAARAAAQACLDEAGISRARLRARLSDAKECLATARSEHPGGPKSELRSAVKECLASR